MATDRNSLLLNLLAPLVREWGQDTVIRAVHDLQESRFLDSEPSERRKNRSAKKQSAVDLVLRSREPNDRRELLTIIAAKYDEKRFLPSLSDVREYLLMHGGQRHPIKDRLDGFRLFLRAVDDLPIEGLERLATTSAFSGPSELGPLSDAIKGSGEARRLKSISGDPVSDSLDVGSEQSVRESKIESGESTDPKK